MSSTPAPVCWEGWRRDLVTTMPPSGCVIPAQASTAMYALAPRPHPWPLRKGPCGGGRLATDTLGLQQSMYFLSAHCAKTKAGCLNCSPRQYLLEPSMLSIKGASVATSDSLVRSVGASPAARVPESAHQSLPTCPMARERWWGTKTGRNVASSSCSTSSGRATRASLMDASGPGSEWRRAPGSTSPARCLPKLLVGLALLSSCGEQASAFLQPCISALSLCSPFLRLLGDVKVNCEISQCASHSCAAPPR